jgi:hypothetical protein
MNTHVKALGWLWIANGVLSVLMAITGLVVVNWPGLIREVGVPLLASFGVLCCFLPGIIVYVLAGYGLLNYRSWARILAIILAIFNLILFPIGTALGIYTLIIMFNDEAEALFSGEGTPAAMEEVS